VVWSGLTLWAFDVMCRAARDIVTRLLTEKGIEVHNNANICSRGASGELLAEDGRAFHADEVFWCTQVASRCQNHCVALKTH
jgi:NADH dehydrogenase FAD-containing subunit